MRLPFRCYCVRHMVSWSELWRWEWTAFVDVRFGRYRTLTCIKPIGAASSAALVEACPMDKSDVPPEKRPSVPRAAGFAEAFGFQVGKSGIACSCMPGPPFGRFVADDDDVVWRRFGCSECVYCVFLAFKQRARFMNLRMLPRPRLRFLPRSRVRRCCWIRPPNRRLASRRVPRRGYSLFLRSRSRVFYMRFCWSTVACGVRYRSAALKCSDGVWVFSGLVMSHFSISVFQPSVRG